MGTSYLFVTGILALCVFAALWALRHTFRYNNTEGRALDSVSAKLNRFLEARATSNTQKGPRSLISIDALLEGLSKQTIIADRLQLIKRMRESQVKVCLSALQQMTLARETSAKWLSLPSYAASLSMMIGLLGTVVGLAAMVQQIGLGLPSDPSQVTMDSWMASIAHIRGVLGAMNTAFSATMSGIASAILLSFLNHRLAFAQSAFLDRLDRFTTETLLPATVPATEDDSLLEKVSLQLEASFTRLDDISKKNQDALVQLSAVEEGFLQIVDTMRQSTKGESLEHIQSMIGRISGIIDQIANLNKSVISVSETLPKIVDQVSQTNRDSLSRIDRLIQTYEQHRSLFQWPLQMKIVFSFLVVLNFVLLGRLLFR